MTANVFVLHIMKTAGTSLRQMLSSAVGGDRVFPSNDDLQRHYGGWYPPNAEMLAKIASPPRDDIGWYIGHYPYSFVKHLLVPMDVVTFLREPVARTVSILKHRRRVFNLHDLPLIAFLDDEQFIATQVRDYLTKVFAIEDPLQAVNTPYHVTERELSRAVDHLSSLDFVGFVDSFYLDFIVLAFKYSFDFTMAPEEHLDRSEPDAELSEQLVERIRGLVKYDLVLYEEARRIFHRRSRSSPQ